MAALSQSIAASGPFRFLVGPEKKEYMMHAELVARLSEPLRALVTGGMDESCRGVVEWPEVDEATFMRFFQFAYTGHFDAEAPEPPPPKSPRLSEAAPEELFEEAEPVIGAIYESFGNVHVLQRRNMRMAKQAWNTPEKSQANLWTLFRELYTPLEIRPTEWPLPEQDPTADFTRVFLAYARLYVLADEKDIQGLLDLSLRRLHHTLVHFNLQEKGADSIASLAEYCFENTCDKGAKQDGLRRLVCLFSACKLEILWTSEAFRRVFAETGDFSIGSVGMLLARLD
ncbi:hypothetical protein PG997_011309 [Apiospora hydei]|uniref:BTB domain-containing protein n=1 Tax=Apiospora hydei TaxID=1337664 RepID=A0ABR1VLD1_9PEZI